MAEVPVMEDVTVVKKDLLSSSQDDDNGALVVEVPLSNRGDDGGGADDDIIQEEEIVEEQDPCEEHLDDHLSFLPHKNATLTELVNMEAGDKSEALKRLDKRVLDRFTESETVGRCEKLNLSCLSLKVGVYDDTKTW